MEKKYVYLIGLIAIIAVAILLFTVRKQDAASPSVTDTASTIPTTGADTTATGQKNAVTKSAPTASAPVRPKTSPEKITSTDTSDCVSPLGTILEGTCYRVHMSRPNGGESWCVGKQQMVYFDVPKTVRSVTLSVKKRGTASSSPIAEVTAANGIGAYNWIVGAAKSGPVPVGAGYEIGVYANFPIGGEHFIPISDVGDGTFTIADCDQKNI